MTIYVVRGSVGEYSDRLEWLVRAFATEDAAKAHVVRCTERGKELLAEFNRLRKEIEAKRPKGWLEMGYDHPDMVAWSELHDAFEAAVTALRNEYDPHGKTDHMNRPGDTYWYDAVELEA